MFANKNKKRMLELLIENEEAVARLYRAFAEKFPRRGKFWSDLAEEEMKHARWIRKMSETLNDSVEIEEDRFDMKAFQISLRYLAEKYEDAINEKISFKDALSTALDIETGMLERGYFEVFAGDTDTLKQTLRALKEDTRKHTDQVRNVLAGKRWRFF